MAYLKRRRLFEGKREIWVELVDISFDEFKKGIDEAKDIVDPIVFNNKLNEKVDEDTLKVALKIYSALHSLIKKYDLDGLTVRCFDLLGIYHNTSCLGLALLNSQGYVATCEGDVPSMLSMLIIKAACNKPSFQANPSKITFGQNEDNTVLFAHCTVPMSMCTDVNFMTHFESDLGIGIRGKLNPGEITIFKLSRDLKTHLLVTGEIKSNPELTNYCRTQIEVKLQDEDLYHLINKSYGNHVIISYGDNAGDIANVLHYYQERFSRK